MPLFDFKCRACGYEAKDVLLNKRSQQPPNAPTCPNCKRIGTMERMLSAASFSIKGFNAANGYSGEGDQS